MKKIISLVLALSMFTSLAVTAHATDTETGEEKGLIGVQAEADAQLSQSKADAVARIGEIRDAYLENPDAITDDERTELTSLLAAYYPDASIDDYLPDLNTSTRSNLGDYTTLDLNLPGKLQETGYWCGPASGYAVLQGRDINVTQSELASKMGTTTDGTSLYNVAPALNKYNGVAGNSFKYATMAGYKLTGENIDKQTWAMRFTNAAISTLIGEYGVIYNVHQVKGSSNYLTGYANSSGVAASNLYHFVAGEGYDSSDPSRRKCYYYDSNNKSGLGDHHMTTTFQVMAVLCNDRGLIY